MNLLAIIGLFAVFSWVFNIGRDSGYKQGRRHNRDS